MAKNTRSYDDEIDLIQLIQVFLTHKMKYIVLGIVGLILGLVYTFQHEPRFETQFKVHVGHPAFSNEFLTKSSAVQELLNASELNQNILPRYQFNEKTNLFTVTTEAQAATEVVTELFTEALKQELMQLKQVAESFEGFDNKPVILNNNNNNDDNNNNNNVTWTNQDMAKLNIEQVVQTLKISFSEPKVLYPQPFKHGAIGIFVGLLLGFVWMMSVIVIRELSRQKK
ncbi:Wzz/FepE/Etk N-terminal domain-containing protein [Methylophilaceae bacterium]|nr:Wzz/FepE/Etk N-terminal domain-containing protein [Methylophilaceae bacterium]